MPTYYIKGGTSKVSLTDRDFVAKGGEKSVFAKGGTAYCVYHDPSAAIPAGKIRELADVNHPGVVVPTAELLDAKKRHCGEVMKFADDSYAPKSPDVKPLVLCQLFTNAFRRKQGVDVSDVVSVTDSIIDVVRHCHSKQVVLVDPNETNWLVKHDLKSVYLIDTSCVQTKGYPGTAIKPAIRDYSSTSFTAESDWYSIAVVLGWLWTGIHPYLAFHPKWKHMDANAAMVPRMKEHWSFFRDGTEFNRACRPIAQMPATLRSWMEAVLDQGKRLPAPDHCGAPLAVVAVTPVTPSQSMAVQLNELIAFRSDVCAVYGDFTTTNEQYGDAAIVFTPRGNVPIAVRTKNGRLHLADTRTGKDLPITCEAKRVLEVDGRAYSVGASSVAEVRFNEVNGEIRATVWKVGSIADLPTTRTFTGCVIQNLLGKYLLSTFPEAGECVQYQLPELEGWQILDAQYQRGVFVVSAEQSGKYQMRMYRFKGASTDSTVISDQIGDVNFAVTDRGIVAIMEPNGTLRVCSNRTGSDKIRQLQFPEPDMQLFAQDNKIVGSLGKHVYDIVLTGG